jgi:hypothetical protein
MLRQTLPSQSNLDQKIALRFVAGGYRKRRIALRFPTISVRVHSSVAQDPPSSRITRKPRTWQPITGRERVRFRESCLKPSRKLSSRLRRAVLGQATGLHNGSDGAQIARCVLSGLGVADNLERDFLSLVEIAQSCAFEDADAQSM